MKNPIFGLGISGYRSFGSPLQQVAPCSKINLIIGQNNSGKSNILTFIHDHYNKLNDYSLGNNLQLNGLEKFRSLEDIKTEFAIALNISEDDIEVWNNEIRSQKHREMGSQLQAALKIISEKDPCSTGFWIKITFDRGTGRLNENSIDTLFSIHVFHQYVEHVLRAVKGTVHQGGDSGRRENIRDFFRVLLQRFFKKSDVVKIPSIREVGSKEIDSADLSGRDIINRLAQLQNPAHDHQHLRGDFEKIEHFLKEVTEKKDAKLEVPFQRNTLIVHMDGKSLPLEALGTGIHEVIIIAAAATSLRNHIICIEEPEVHLHPLLQKKLLRYLDVETENQYFISTHSAHLLDHNGASIFHVTLNNNGSNIISATEPSQKFSICKDLGYRASDLLQTNCIIWVEGPSDRIYIREWIRLGDPELIEGIDYSIMFYGGRLLSHLSPNDSEIEEFISLRKLNQNMVIVMDSDKTSSRARINSTKMRVKNDWESHHGFTWITQGREIENYIRPEAILEALQIYSLNKVHAKIKSQFDKCIGKNPNGSSKADKVKIAHWLSDNNKLDLKVLDLEKQIKALCKFIIQSNHSKTIKK